MQVQFLDSLSSDGEGGDMFTLKGQHQAYVSALRDHAGLLRDLDRTISGVFAALDEAGIDPARRASLAGALENHIARARHTIASIDERLTMALGRPDACH